ncbi:MAG: alpha/beta hydrolase [Halioglobus sp.]|nr:alpha/beta hydrolase [Halioglobus sp.]
MAQQPAPRHPVAVKWEVNDLQLAGLSWGNPQEKPLLALHGWLDNAASFAYLAPLLEGYNVVALDLTGHGQSARRSTDASYQIWDDLPEILGVIDALGWDSFQLVGHSRGAIIATLLASAFPEKVRALVLLDALTPQPVAEQTFPAQLRKALQEKPRLQARSNRIFPSVEEAVATREASGLDAAAARMLVERNLRPCPGGVTWTTDARLRGASAVKLSKGQINAVLGALTMPTLLLLAEDSSLQMPGLADYAIQYIERLSVRTVEGGHHFHMEFGVNEIALQLQQFLSSIQECESA